jgi:hypothetical protein
MEHIKIENHPNLLRDQSTSAIINTNNTARDNYLKNYDRMKREKEEFENLKTQVSSLSSDMADIKSMLKLLVTEKKNDN